MKRYSKEEMDRRWNESQERRMRYALADKNRSLTKNWARRRA